MRVGLLLLCIIATCFTVNATNNSENKHWADSVFAKMTLDEKIGQLFMIAAYSNRNSTTYESTVENIMVENHIGGIIFFQGDPLSQARMTRRYQKSSKYPLLIGLDAEHGVGWRLKGADALPKMAILGATTDNTLSYREAAIIAKQSNAIGVHINFAPVVDINSNPNNPVIGIRSFGEDINDLSAKAIQYMKGSLSYNVMPVIKHFPGHGDTETDSHFTLPVIKHNVQHLYNNELKPFEILINADAPAVMVSHLSVPAIDSSNMPATLSPLLVNGVLKKDLGFDGLVFTDAMNMKGVTSIVPCGEAEVLALIAGADVILFPEDPEVALSAVRDAVQKGRISETLINEKCYKVLQAKEQYALNNIMPKSNEIIQAAVKTKEADDLRRDIYKNALTLIKNNDNLLPLRNLDTLKIASLNFGGTSINNFQYGLERYTDVKHFKASKDINSADLENLYKSLSAYNTIIIYNNIASSYPRNNYSYSTSLEELIKKLDGKRIILCHPAMPYGLKSYINLNIDAIIISNENHAYAREYASQAIFGGCEINGKLSVGINEDYPVGTSISTSKNRLGYTNESSIFTSKFLKQIDDICTQAITDKATPGCQVLVAYKGNIVYNKAYGKHTYEETSKENQTNDIYDVASITKIVATMPLIMELSDENIINIDSTLSTYYSKLKGTNKNNILIRDILCHNSGLKSTLLIFRDAVERQKGNPVITYRQTEMNTLKLSNNLYANPNVHFRKNTFSYENQAGFIKLSPHLYINKEYQDSVMYKIIKTKVAEKAKYTYSDLGFVMLRYAIEEATNTDFEQMCNQMFYKRLGMNNTTFLPLGRQPIERIIPSSNDNLFRKTRIQAFVHDPLAAALGGVSGHAGLFATAEDLAKIMQMYLNGGTYGGERYINQETIDKFTAKNAYFNDNRRGLGFDKPESDKEKPNPVSDYASPESYGHTGYTGTMAWCDPDNELLYIFLSNRTYPDEFNTKLIKSSVRTKIQDVLYSAIIHAEETHASL